jgi:hypothetical protein
VRLDSAAQRGDCGEGRGLGQGDAERWAGSGGQHPASMESKHSCAAVFPAARPCSHLAGASRICGGVQAGRKRQAASTNSASPACALAVRALASLQCGVGGRCGEPVPMGAAQAVEGSRHRGALCGPRAPPSGAPPPPTHTEPRLQ